MSAFFRNQKAVCFSKRYYMSAVLKFLIPFFFSASETADLVKFTEGILNGKLHFLCSEATSFSFIPPKDIKKTAFQIRSGGIAKDQWYEIG